MRKTRWLPLGAMLVALSLLLASAVSASPDAGGSLQVLSRSTNFKAMQANPPAVSSPRSGSRSLGTRSWFIECRRPLHRVSTYASSEVS
jgi:hypothetical protein